MEHVADRVVHDIHLGSEMRPRRWYTDEIAPQRRRNVKLNTHHWRYRSFIRRKAEHAAPVIGAACSFVRMRYPLQETFSFGRLLLQFLGVYLDMLCDSLGAT
jgi:hypothetical protein